MDERSGGSSRLGPDSADDVRLTAPAGGDANIPQVEIEFEVVSTFRPRLVRVKPGDGRTGAQEYRIAGADGTVAAEGGGEAAADDPLATVILWALYEACRSDGGYGDHSLPWERPHHAGTWRAFRRAMLSDPELHQRWSDPAALLQRARAAYRAHHRDFDG